MRRARREIFFLLMTVALAPAQTLPTNPAAPSARVVSSQPAYQPITGKQRFRWFLDSTLGPETLAAGLVTSAIGTARDAPGEYGPHWEGFGKRYGMRLTGISTSNAMEAGLGALWHEDPRYVRTPHGSFQARAGNVFLSSFTSHNPAGQRTPAYARFVAIPGNNFLSNTWRADSEATNRDAALRTLWGFVGEMSKNAFFEFWPDAQRRLFRHQR